MHPEPSMQEHETAAYVVERLREIGLADIQTGIGETGVVCLIRGAKKRGKTVALRADMDALEMAEETGAEYASRKPGLMHACGHDGHTACLLGAAAILHGMRERLPGNVKLIFQPGEEGAGGALKMIEDGCLARPKVSAIAALHVFGDLQSGAIGLNHGYITAQTDEIELIIRGVSAHAARPHTGVDSISVAAQALIAIQQFVARHTDPIDRRLVTFGIIEGGTRSNILAQQVRLRGTVRTFEPKSRDAILRFVKRDLRRLVGAMGARLRVSHDEGYPPLANDEDVINTIGEAARETLGEARVHELTVPSLGGEDFAYFARAGVPTAMGRLGTYDEEKGFTSTVHRTDFDFDDGVVLPTGAAALAQTAMRLLDA
jgi:amidohydrolase